MISTTIITLNEEENIEKALKNLSGLVSEIIIVDSGSTDKTIGIAKSLGAKVFYRKFDNFANQKNWAVSKAENDWILSLDADEEISNELAAEIKQAIRNNKYNAYLIPRRNFILGKEIKHSRWSPDKHIWLWDKRFGKWIGDVHEEVVVNGKVGSLKNPKLHYSHKTINEFIKSNDHYSTLEARALLRRGVKFNFLKMIWQAKFEFILRFVYKMGFLDGWRGFVLAYLMGIYKLMVWIKLWELDRKN